MLEISENCCRICLKQNGSEFRDLNNPCFGEFSALDVLNQVFNLDVECSPTSNLPQKICFYCNAKLAISMEVWNLALESQNSVNNRMRALVQDEVEVKMDVDDVVSVEAPLPSNESHSNVINFEEFAENVTDSGSIVSNATSSSVEEVLMQQTRCIVSIEPLNPAMLEQKEPRTLPRCTLCCVSFNSEDELNRHNATHQSKTHTCTICDKNFAVERDLKSHMTQKHPGIKEMDSLIVLLDRSCESSEFLGFDNETSIEEVPVNLGNSSSFHNQINEKCSHESWKCYQCKQVFLKKLHLQRHLKFAHNHKKDGPFKCSKCDEVILDSCHYNQHNNEIHGPGDCLICNRSFGHKQELLLHTQQHKKKGDFVCKICSLQFETMKGLLVHFDLMIDSLE